jgi:chemotaxis protein CheX
MGRVLNMTPAQDILTQGAAPTILALTDCLDLTAAAPLTAELLAARGAPVSLDGSAVRRIGGQCLQVLLAAQAAWATDGLAFEVVNPSPELADCLALMGAIGLACALSDQD